MTAHLDLSSSRVLFCCAHPSEAKALPSGHGCLVTGVGKVPACLTLERYLREQPLASVQGVFMFGVAGVYPSADATFDSALAVGQAVWVTQDALIDEGVCVPDGFLDLDELGLRGQVPAAYQANPAWMQALRRTLALPECSGATVSTCAGTDALGLSRARRTGAAIESMEGAALAQVCWQREIPWVQLRVVSNRCAQRAHAGWDLPRALGALRQTLEQLLAA